MKLIKKILTLIFLFGLSTAAEVSAQSNHLSYPNHQYAILVGINDYANPLVSDLSEPIEDTNRFYNLFKSKGYDAIEVYGDDHVEQYDSYTERATKHNVRSAILNLANKAKPGDIIVIAFMGHGGGGDSSNPLPINNDFQVFLCMVDYWSPIVARFEAYEDFEIADDLNHFANGVNVVFIADSCFSGGIGPDIESTITNNRFGTLFFSACAGNETSSGAFPVSSDVLRFLEDDITSFEDAFEGIADEYHLRTTPQIVDLNPGHRNPVSHMGVSELEMLNIPFYEGSGNTIHDLSGYGHDGVMTGAHWNSGGLYFDGYGDYVNGQDVAETFLSDPTGYDVFWEFSAFPVSSTGYHYIISTGGQTSSRGFAATAKGNMLWIGMSTADSSVSTGYSIPLNFNEWNRIKVVFTGSKPLGQGRQMDVYLNGTLHDTYLPQNRSLPDVYTQLTIGRPNNAHNYYWIGYIADIRAGLFVDSWETLNLPLNENSGVIAHDLSPRALESFITGAAWETEGLYFDGYGDYINSNYYNNSFLSDPTGHEICWEFSAFPVSTSGYHYIVSTGGQTSSRGFAAVANGNMLWVGMNTAKSSVSTGYSIPLNLNEWNNIKVVFSGSKPMGQGRLMHVYLNGSLFHTYLPYSRTLPDAYTQLTIGRSNNAYGYYWKGYIADVRVWNISGN